MCNDHRQHDLALTHTNDQSPAAVDTHNNDRSGGQEFPHTLSIAWWVTEAAERTSGTVLASLAKTLAEAQSCLEQEKKKQYRI